MKRLGLAFSCVLLTAGCVQSSTQEVTVFAASSLQGAFDQLASEFAKTHSEFEVVFSFDSSTQLSHQIIDGAPADVFASADTDSMDRLVQNNEVAGVPEVFTTNHLMILVAHSAADRIHSLADLSIPNVVVVLAAPDVPLGRYTVKVLAAAGVAVTPASYETSASGVVSKISSGEADAGIVYVSDVVGVGNAAFGVDIPLEHNVRVQYPIAVTRFGAQHAGAALWVKFVLSARGREVLQRYGFSSIDNK